MENPSMILKRASLVALVIVATLVYARASAGEEGVTFPMSESGFYGRSDLTNDYSEDISPPGGAGLTIPLTGSLSVDLSLSAVDGGQALTGVKPFGAPSIPVTKPGGVDLRSYMLGAGFSFRF
jgi:hypothetical protein